MRPVCASYCGSRLSTSSMGLGPSRTRPDWDICLNAGATIGLPQSCVRNLRSSEKRLFVTWMSMLSTSICGGILKRAHFRNIGSRTDADRVNERLTLGRYNEHREEYNHILSEISKQRVGLHGLQLERHNHFVQTSQRQFQRWRARYPAYLDRR